MNQTTLPDNSESARIEIVPRAALVFTCPSCGGLSIAEGISGVVNVGHGARIETACSGCKQPLTLGRVEPPRVVTPHVGPNREQRRAAASGNGKRLTLP